MTGEERELVEKLPQLWYDLVLKSKNIDASLVVVKRKFTEVCIDEYELVYMVLKIICHFETSQFSMFEIYLECTIKD